MKIMQAKCADLIHSLQEKETQLTEAKKESRGLRELADECQDDLEYKEDLEKQYHIISERLRIHDKKYRYE